MKIGGATLNQTPLHWQNNTQNIIDAIEEAKTQDIEILCLPELCVTGYGCEDLFLSDWLSEKAWKELLKIKAVCTNIIACIGIPVRIDKLTYNGVCVISDGKILGVTLKQNLAKDGVHYEPRWFEEWKPDTIVSIERQGEKIEAGDVTYEANGVRFGFEICEDAWQKNRAGYNLYKKGVQLILNPSASHFSMGKILSRQDVVLTGSKLFNCVYLYVNLLGNEAGRMIYDGDIIIADHGKIIAANKRLSFKPYSLLSCDVDFNTSETNQQTEIETPDRNEELAQAATLALFDYLRKSKAKGYVLSLSGGADSSACAVLVAEMVKRAAAELGWEKICLALGLNPTEIKNDPKKATSKLLTCAYQSTKNSSQTTLQSAKELANSIGAEFHHWSVDGEINSYTQKIQEALQRTLTWETDDITLQNIQARSRSPIIWMLANIKKAVLLTTSNRSEGDVGYATMDGDTSGSLAPIAGIDKPTIIQWLKWAEKSLGYHGLQYVNRLPPTAELKPTEKNQTDETDLMPYAVLVEIEKHAILKSKSPVEVYQAMAETSPDRKLLKTHIRKFFTLWAANQWKRERLAPSFHLDELNVDPRSWYRFPILSSGFSEELKKLDLI